MGIRWAESVRRKNKRRMVEQCYRDSSFTVNPIIDWTDKNIWDFIHSEKIEYCSLYDNGWKRIGCMFCPSDSGKHKYLLTKLYPKITYNFIKAFQKFYEIKTTTKCNEFVSQFKNGEELFYWWISNKPVNKTGQFSFME